MEDIPKGKIIEQCHCLLVPMSLARNAVLKMYIFAHPKEKRKAVLPMGYGMIYNQSIDKELVSVGYWYLPDINLMVFQTLKDVKKGGEFLVDYGPNNTGTKNMSKNYTNKSSMKTSVKKGGG